MRKQTKRKPRMHFQQVPIAIVKAMIGVRTMVPSTQPNAKAKRPHREG